MMQASVSGGASLPSLESEESVTLQSHDGKGLGLNVSANTDGSFTIQDIEADGVAGASGKIKAGDRLTGIGIDLSKLKPDEAPKLLNAIAAFPVKFSIKKQGSGSAGLGAGLKLDPPKFDVGINGAKGDIRVPEGNLGIGFSGKGPSIGGEAAVDLPHISAEVDGTSKGGIDINLPQVEIDPGSVEFPGGKSGSIGNKLKGFFSPGNGKKDKHGKGKGKIDANVSLPSVELGSGKIGGNIDASVEPVDVDLSIEKPNVNVDISGPSVEGDLRVKAPKADRESWFDKHKPKISLGKSGKYSVADASANIDTDVPSLEGNIAAPKGDLKEKVELKGNLPKVGIDFPHISGDAGVDVHHPKADFSVTGPHIDANIDSNIGLPKANIEASIPDTSGNISVTAPSVEFIAPDIDIESPGTSIGGKIKGFFKRGDSKKKKGKLEDSGGIKLSLDADVPKLNLDGNTNLNLSQEHKIQAPEADFKLAGPSISGNIEGVGLNLEGKVHADAPDAQLDYDRSQLHDTKGKGKVECHLPDVDVKVDKPKGGIHFGMPKFGFKGKGPKGEIDVGGNASLPSGGIEGHIDGPDVNVELDKPKGSGGFKIDMPSVGFKGKGPKGELDLDADASIPSGDIGGKVECHLPEADIKVDKPKGGIHFEMPKFGMKGKGPKGEIDAGGNASLPSGGIEGHIEGPDVNVDVDKHKGSGGFKIGMPSFGFKGKGPKGELDVDADASIPSGDIGGKVECHLPEADIKVDKPKGGIHFEMPKFGMKGKSPKGEIDVGGNASLPSGGIEGHIDGPDVNVDVDKPKGSGGFKIGMPSFGLKGKGPKGELDLDADASIPSGDIGGKVECHLPEADIKVDKPKGGIHFEMPKFGLESKSPKGEINVGGDASLPSGGFEGKINEPDVNVNLDKPKGGGGFKIGLPSFGIKGKGPKGEIDVGGNASLPSGGIEGDIEGPDVNVDVDKPKGSGGFKIDMPSFGFKGKSPKGELDLDADASIPSGDIGGKVECHLPESDVKVDKPKGGIHFGMPKFGMKGKGPKGEIDVGGNASLPSGGIEGSIEGPDVGVDVGKPKGSGGFKIDMPSFGFKGKSPKGGLDANASIPSPDIEGNAECHLPNADVKVDKPKGGIHFEMPKFGIRGKSPKGEFGVGDGTSLPSGTVDGKIEGHLPEVGLGKLEGRAGLEGTVDADLPDVDVNVKKSKSSGGIHFGLPRLSFKGKSPKADGKVVEKDLFGGLEGTVKGSTSSADADLNIQSPSVEFDSPEVKVGKRGLGSKMKGLFSKSGKEKGKIKGNAGINVDIPDVDVNVAVPKIDIKGTAEDTYLNGDRGALHDSNIKTGKGSGDIQVGLPSLSFKGKSPKGDIDAGADVSLPVGKVKGKIDADFPDVELKGEKPKASGGIQFGLPSLDLKGKGPKGDNDFSVGASLPSGKLEGKFDADVPDIELKGEKPKGSGGIQFGLPSLDFKGKGPKGNNDFSVDASLPSGKLEGKFDADVPDIELKGEKPKGSGGIQFGLPSLDLKGKGPKGDIDFDVGASLPAGKLEGKFDADIPDIELKGEKPKGSGGIHFGLPSLDFKGKGPKGDLDFGVDAAKSSGKLEGKIDADLPDVDLKGEKPKGSGGVHIELPSFDFKGKCPKGGIEVGADTSIPSDNIEGKIDADFPDVKLKGETPKGSGGFHIGRPSFGLKGKGAKGDVDVDTGVSLPSGKVEGKITNDVDPKVVKAKGSGGFSIGMPKFRTKGKAPDASADIKIAAPTADVHIPSTKIQFDSSLQAPDVEKGGHAEVNLPNFGVDVGASSPGVEGAVNFEGPEVDIDSPKVKGSKKVDLGGKMKKLFSGGKRKGKGDLKGDISVDLPAADVNLLGPEIGVEGKVDVPRFDAGVKTGKGSSGVEVSLPKVDVHASSKDVEGKIGANVKVPKGGVESSGGFNIGLPKLSSKGDKAEVDTSLGTLDGTIKATAPETKMDAGSVKGNFPLGLPKFGINWEGSKEAEDMRATRKEMEGKLSAGVGEAEIGFDHIQGRLPEIEGGAGVQVNLPKISLDKNTAKLDSGLDISATAPKAVVTAGLPSADIHLGKGKGSADASFQGPSLDVSVEPKAGVSGGFDLESPSVQSGQVEFKSEKRGSLGRKVKGFFSSKDRSSSPKADIDVSLGVAGDKPTGSAAGGVKVTPPGVSVDLKKGKDECFATSYDAGLHREAAIDVPSPSLSIGSEAECNSPTSDNEYSMLHDEKSPKFHLKIGGGKSSKSKADKKTRPRIEAGLRSGLATELIASAGHVQLPETDDKSRQSEESRTHDKKKGSSQSEA